MREVPTPTTRGEEVVFDTLAGEALVEAQDTSLSDEFRSWLFDFADALIERMPADSAKELRSLKKDIQKNLKRNAEIMAQWRTER